MSEIKIFCFFHRRVDVSEDDFHAHWRHPHGTLAKNMRGFERYIQAHRLGGVSPPGLASPHDACAELWFASIDVATELADDPVYQQDVVPDEARFIELNHNAFRVVTTEEFVREGQFDSSDRGVKLLHCIRRRTATSVRDIQQDLDASTERELGEALGVTRHLICRAVDESYGDEFVPFDGKQHAWRTDNPFDAVRELWWDDEASMNAAIAANPQAWRALLSGGGVDPTRSAGFVSKELVVL